jgi:hypothetical protein
MPPSPRVLRSPWPPLRYGYNFAEFRPRRPAEDGMDPRE